jgi:hypothetical protein
MKNVLKFNKSSCEHGVKGAYLDPTKCIICKVAYNQYKQNKKSPKDNYTKNEQKPNPTNTKTYKSQEFSVDEYIKKYREKNNLTKEELGIRYERYIGYKYEIQGYKVEFIGIKAIKNKSINDNSIDLICKKRKEHILIQCKRYGKGIELQSQSLGSFDAGIKLYKKKNPDIKVSSILYTINDNLSHDARKILDDYDFKHIIEPHTDYYPLIKCNIGKNSSKIFHIPNKSLYDTIKIETKKGEFYCETEQEAKNKGFTISKR